MTGRGALGAVAVAALLAGCGSGSDDGSPPTTKAAAHPLPTEATVRAADCTLWNVLDAGQRGDLLAAMRVVFGGPVSGTPEHGQTLTDVQAIAVLDRSCAPSYAAAFKLYKLYGRAAAFTTG